MDEYLKNIIDRPARKLSAADKKAISLASAQNMIQEIQELESRAHDLGMHVTAHALNRAKNALGWEISGNVEQAGKASFALAQ